MVPFLNWTLKGIVDFFQPLATTWLWPMLVIFGFLKTIPIAGVFVPSLFFILSLGIYEKNPILIVVGVLIFTAFMVVSDFVTQSVLYKFWIKAIEKTSYKKEVHKLFSLMKKAPLSTLFGGAWTNYLRPHMIIAAKHSEVINKKFWIVRYASLLIVNSIYAFGGYLLSNNIETLSDGMESISNIITIIFIILLAIGFFVIYKRSEGVDPAYNLLGFFKSILRMKKDN